MLLFVKSGVNLWKFGVSPIWEEGDNFLPVVAVVERKNDFGHSVLFCYVASVLLIQIHDVWVRIFVKQVVNLFHHLIFYADMQRCFAKLVYMVNAGTPQNEPCTHSEVADQELMHENCAAAYVLLVQVSVSER